MWIFEWPLGWFRRSGGITIFQNPGIRCQTYYSASQASTRATSSLARSRF